VLESCAKVTIGPWRWNSYFACGFTGYLVGLVLAMWLSWRAGFALPARLVVAIGPPFTFLIVTAVIRSIAGHERIVFYEKALSVVAITAPAAWLAGGRFLEALDAVTLGLGAFLAFGRAGCLRVGCCYGRPWRYGIRYGHDHVLAGFDARLRDVPLLPIQIADGAVAAAMTVIGVLIARTGPAGHATALWAAGYGVSRFTLELLRGDPRPDKLGVSEAQWTALVTSSLAILLWPAPAIIACAALIAVATAAIALARRRDWPRAFWLARPDHLHELDALVGTRVASADASATVTGEGLRVSVHPAGPGVYDVVASHVRYPLDARLARAVAEQLGARWQLVDAVAGRTPGLVHLMLRPRD
jgi:prolipoprotein diacylglyceryltransferase